MGPLFAVTLQDVRHDDAGAASGTTKSAEQLGALLGVTVIGAVYFAHVRSGGYGSGFAAAAVVEIGVLLVVAVLSLAAPRRFRSEDELGLDV
jgi:hypothetical protein